MDDLHEYVGRSGKKYYFRYLKYDEFDSIQRKAARNIAPAMDELLMQYFPNGRVKPRDRNQQLSTGEEFTMRSWIMREAANLLVKTTLVKIDDLVLSKDSSFNDLIPGIDAPGLEAFCSQLNAPDEEIKKKSETELDSENSNNPEMKLL